MSKEIIKIHNWEELDKVEPNDKYYIEVDLELGCATVYDNNDDEYMEYLSTHTFYPRSDTKVLQKYGFNIELVLWDRIY